MNRLSWLFLPLLMISCRMEPDPDQIKEWKQDILQTEQDFARMVKEKGMHAAFTAFAAPDAVLMRNNSLVKGKEAIDRFYQGQDATGLAWTPDFIEVAASGDLGYTYGQYTYSFVDSAGHPAESKGVFHSVWKRQPDGKWKFVWD